MILSCLKILLFHLKSYKYMHNIHLLQFSGIYHNKFSPDILCIFTDTETVKIKMKLYWNRWMISKEIMMYIQYRRELPIIIIYRMGYILCSYVSLCHANLMIEILYEDRLLEVLFCYKYLNMLRMYYLSDWNCCRDIIVTSEESHNASSITTVWYYMLHFTLHMNTMIILL